MKKVFVGFVAVTVGSIIGLLLVQRECGKALNKSFPDGEWLRSKRVA